MGRQHLLGARQPDAVLLGLLSFGEVAGDLTKPDELPSFVAKRGDDDVRPKARAVLANAPTLILEASDARRFLELVLPLAGAVILFRIEE